jgi:hypothetical protein
VREALGEDVERAVRIERLTAADGELSPAVDGEPRTNPGARAVSLQVRAATSTR